MARLIALEWDRIEARILVGRPQGDNISVEQVLTVPLSLDGQGTNFEGLEDELRKALSQAKASKSQAVTAIGRSLIELRTMQLPPAPEEELPDMVRFQAMREFSTLTADSPLDFVPLGAAAQQSGEVMAAAIPLELSQHVEAAITGSGHEPTRSVMRPCAAASLAMRRHPELAKGITMIIAQQADSVELGVAITGKVVFTRSFKLPANWHPGETGEPLLGEVRRTIAAAQNQLGGQKIERIVMFGTEPEHTGLCKRITDRTALDVTLIDPFEGVTNTGTSPDQPERFAALIGMLQDEVQGTRPDFDFLNPRKRPEPESNRRQHVLYAATAATVLLGLVFMIWMQHNALNTTIQKQQRAINKLSRENRALLPTVGLAKKLRDWKRSDKNWLDELVHLSQSAELTAEDYRLESITGRTLRDFRGEVRVRGRSRNLEARQKLQNELADEDHRVVPGLVTSDAREDARYPVLFTTTLQTDKFFEITIGQQQQEPVEPDTATKTEETATKAEDTEEKERA